MANVLNKVVGVLRSPQARRAMLWRTRKVLVVAVMVIESILQDVTTAIVAA